MSRTSTNRKSIVVIQLQHDIPSKSLKERAIAGVLAKTLYQNNVPLSIPRLASKAAGLADLPQISNKVVESGIKWLVDNGWAQESSRGWQLSDQGRRRVEVRHTESDERIKYILEKHFGSSIDVRILKQWFLQAAVDFFAEFGEVISRALLRESVTLPDRARLKSILEKSITDADLGEHRDALISGFYALLNDIDPRSEAQKLSFALTRMSARLIAAATGPDPIAVPEFENAKLFLDTNVLLLVRVDAGAPGMSDGLIVLSKALKSIGATLHIIRPTKEEYEAVVARKRTETLKVLSEGVSVSVLERSIDPFLKAATKYGARNEEAFIRFFDSISCIPDSVESVEIGLLESAELHEEIEKAKNSPKRSEIMAEWKKLRGKEKKQHLAEHDAALDAAALFYRRQEGKGWVITRDRSMLNLSRRWHDRAGLPVWVYLEALVEILAAYGTGPSYKPEEFAPLLGALIRSDVQETLDSFQVEDLGELADIDSRVFELTDDEVISFARKVHQMKLTGEEEGSSDLQLHLKRTFQGRRLADNNAAEKARADVRSRELKIEITREIGIKALTQQLLPQIRWRHRRHWVPYVFIAVLLLGGIYWCWKAQNTALLITFATSLVIDLGIPVFKELFASNGAKIENMARDEAERKWTEQEQLQDRP